MGLQSSLLNLIGVVLLAHAVYSAHEHSLLPNTPLASSTPHTGTTTTTTAAQPNPLTTALSYLIPTIDLPLDIILETLLSVLLICSGVVLGSPDLKPIQWRVWAGQLQREKWSGDVREIGPRGNPYEALEDRAGFLDIRRSRREFAGWVKEGAKGDAGVEVVE